MTSQRPATIVFADDEPAIRRLFCAMLEGSGVRVLPAADGPEALQLVRSEHPDLVILDLAMPKMDGAAVCRAVKADAATCDIPVWMLSAYVSSPDGRLSDVPADERIEKPFSPRTLRVRIMQALAPRLAAQP